MTADFKPETWIAIYAAIVATSAFFLNLRTWMEGRPRLYLSLMPDAVVLGGAEEEEERDLMVLTVTNRGKSATVITHMVLFKMVSWYQLWRIRPAASYFIPNPQLKGYPHNIPADLEPAKKWTGVLRKRPDLTPDIQNGTYYVGVYASHRDRPYLMRIPRPKRKLPGDTKEHR